MVHSSCQSDQKPSLANWGSGVDLAAPGVGILSTALVPGSTAWCGSVSSSTSLCSGTSMATAHVSAVAALVRERYPGWTNSQVIARLKSTAYDLGAGGYDTVHGYGRVQAYEAVNMSVQMAGPHSRLARIQRIVDRVGQWRSVATQLSVVREWFPPRDGHAVELDGSKLRLLH